TLCETICETLCRKRFAENALPKTLCGKRFAGNFRNRSLSPSYHAKKLNDLPVPCYTVAIA
ncbi:MAG: hypothetical protein RR951_10800, partial [Ruthenibacterium sp.]